MTTSAVKRKVEVRDPAAFVGGLGQVSTTGVPAWLGEARRLAAERFAARGLPTIRDEAWRSTDLRVLARHSFVAAPAEAGAAAEAGAVLADLPMEGPRLVFVDGQFRAELSVLHGLPKGVEVSPLGALLGESADLNLVRRAFEEAEDDGAVVDLNTAFAGEGAVVRVRRGVACDKAIALVFIGSGAGETAFHSRNLLIVEDGATAAVIERHAGPAARSGLDNQVMRIEVGAGARLSHAVIQDVAVEAYALSTSRVTVARDGTYEAFVLATGGRLSRQEMTVRLQGPGAECRLSGAYLMRGEQHADFTTVIHHEAPHTTCRETIKGVVDDRARGVFQGRIVVHRGADKTDGQQSSRAILLSNTATVDAKPELEIYADDVKCAHGATAGELDAQALFYLRARGIPRARARALLIQAFVEDAIDNVSHEGLREAVRERAVAWLKDVGRE